MTDQMMKLVKILPDNKELSKAIDQVCDSDLTEEEKQEKIIALANENGISITKEDLDSNSSIQEMNDDELEAVSGGGGCGCVLPGGGGGDGLKCGCFTGGNGRVFEYRPATDDYLQLPWDQGGCVCAGAGVGATHRH